MAAKKMPAKATGKATSASNARSSAQKNQVTSNIPSQIMPQRPIKILADKNPVGIASAIAVKTVLGGASLASKAIRKATPLPDKPKRAVPTQPSRTAKGGFGNPLVVPVKRNTAQNNRVTSNVTKKAAPKKK
jgi:hypothetical protein